MRDDEKYAQTGIPRPDWCDGTHVISGTSAPGRVSVLHAAAGTGAPVRAGGLEISTGLNWMERCDDGTWQPFRGKDATVFLRAGQDYIALEATERNMAGLAAVAGLISPAAGQLVRQPARLIEETRRARPEGHTGR